jgi:hypothetical protein
MEEEVDWDDDAAIKKAAEYKKVLSKLSTTQDHMY